MDYEKLKEVRNIGFDKHVGFVVTEISEGYTKTELVLTGNHRNPIGSIHGGVMLTMADVTAGIAATSRGRYVTTMNSSMNFLRPAIDSKKLIAESREIKIGKKVCVYEVTITDDADREIAVATISYHYLGSIAGKEFLNTEE